MSEWIKQFSSSYASAIAYGLTGIILSFLYKPISIAISNYKKRLFEKRLEKQTNKLILPTEQETRRYSLRQQVSESEWKNAITFLTNEIKPPPQSFSKQYLFVEKLVKHFNNHERVYQLILIILALVNIIAVILNLKFMQVLVESIIGIFSLLMLFTIGFSLVLIVIQLKQEKSKLKQVKEQIRNAINVISPGLVFTYGQLGELLTKTNEKDLVKLQSNLSEIGLSFPLDTIKVALFLATAPNEELLPITEKLVSSLEQLASLDSEQKKEFAQILINTLRLWPISSEHLNLADNIKGG